MLHFDTVNKRDEVVTVSLTDNVPYRIDCDDQATQLICQVKANSRLIQFKCISSIV